MELFLKEQIVLEQMRQHHRETVASYRALDAKALSLLEIGSIIITLLTGFQLANSKLENGSLLIIALIFYACTAICAFKVIFPKEIQREPIQANWEAISAKLKEPDDTFLYTLLSGYEDSIKANDEVNSEKAFYLRLTFILLTVTVAVSLLAVFFVK